MNEFGAILTDNIGFLTVVTVAVAALFIALHFPFGENAVNLASIPVGIFGSYHVTERLLADRLVGDRSGPRYLAWFVMSLLGSAGILLGLVLMLVPGLALVAGWAATGGFIVVDRMGGAAALAASWRATTGSRLPIAIFLLIGLLLLAALFAGLLIISGLFYIFDESAIDPFAVVASYVFVSVLSTCGLVVGAAIYRLAMPLGRQLAG